MITESNHTIQFTIHQKKNHNGVYLHWKSFALEAWKISTLKTSLFREHNICSNEELFSREIKCLQHVLLLLSFYKVR